MANATSTQLQELYVAYFGRAADPTGLDYWVEEGITTAAFAANMYAQPEFEAEYGSKSVAIQVDQIYQNLFDRSADTAGLTYWVQQINLGKLQLAEIANDLIWAAQNNSGNEADKTALANRTEAATRQERTRQQATSIAEKNHKLSLELTKMRVEMRHNNDRFKELLVLLAQQDIEHQIVSEKLSELNVRTQLRV